MFKKEDQEKAPVDLNDLIQEVLGHVRGELRLDARNCDRNRADWTTPIGGRQSRPIAAGYLNNGFGIGSPTGPKSEIRDPVAG
jgi:hypothetical protein